MQPQWHEGPEAFRTRIRPNVASHRLSWRIQTSSFISCLLLALFDAMCTKNPKAQHVSAPPSTGAGTNLCWKKWTLWSLEAY